MDANQAFIQAIEQVGLTPPRKIIADGKIHRFSANGKASNHSGWYVLHDNIHSYVGKFGDWGTGLKVDWHDKAKPLTHQQVKEAQQIQHRNRPQQEAEKARLRALAGVRIKSNWFDAVPANEDHPYLVKKGIKPHNAKQLGEKLIIPVWKSKKLISLQYINEQGVKYFHKGSSYQGGFGIIGNLICPTSNRICIVEGFATAASIHEATGCPVVIAFSAGNLMTVSKRVSDWADSLIGNKWRAVICGDDDRGNEINVGREIALAAGKELGLTVVFPFFSNPNSTGSDFNDLHVSEGIEAVKACIHSQLNNGGYQS
ncbi:hypothetical conserved protein (plasmid) [Candidatus Nitrosoglobus terrae]|uniref:Hypothetical conserved protein n=1 Tax=Candidatus Nitrosoglobus terrae TaxID=1630141 RepID=A0A1Q2SQ14_9GAMM|nr:hypothetical conserved protein [Candidatus Nitrosoglobus terrae]